MSKFMHFLLSENDNRFLCLQSVKRVLRGAINILRVSLCIGGDNCFDLLLVVLLFPLKLCTNNPTTSTQPLVSRL